MQSPPPQWNAPAPRRSNGTSLVLIIVAVILTCGLLFCGGGGWFVWRAGVGDAVACTNDMSSGDYKKAIPACREYVRKLPKSGDGHNNLAWCLALDGDYQEAVSEARLAVRLQPMRNTYDTLAMALARSGQGSEAEQVENEHVIVNGDVADDSEHVTWGMVYYSVGRKVDAHKQWEIARTGNDPEAQKLAVKFESQYPTGDDSEARL